MSICSGDEIYPDEITSGPIDDESTANEDSEDRDDEETEE